MYNCSRTGYTACAQEMHAYAGKRYQQHLYQSLRWLWRCRDWFNTWRVFKVSAHLPSMYA